MTMKRSIIAVSLALAAGMAFAATNEYRPEAGEQDGAVSIADAYRFNSGEQDESQPKG